MTESLEKYALYGINNNDTTFTAPSSPPDDYSIINRTPFSLKFQWNLPVIPNGPIINYTLIVDYNNGTNITLSLGVASLSYTLSGLMPYQLINATISASTIEGPGPQSQLSDRTLQDSEYYHTMYAYS